MKPVVALLLLLSFGSAPFQCAHQTRSNRRAEDTPAEAMWNLAEHFREQGMTEARQQTLRQIIDDYPSSRQAEQARLVLDGRELTPPVASTTPTPTPPTTTSTNDADAAPTTGASN